MADEPNFDIIIKSLIDWMPEGRPRSFLDSVMDGAAADTGTEFNVALEPNGIGYYAKVITWTGVVDFTTLIQVVNAAAGPAGWYYTVKKSSKMTKEGFSIASVLIKFNEKGAAEVMRGLLDLSQESSATDMIRIKE